MWLKTEGWFTSSCSTLLNQPGENCIDVRFSILFISLFSVLGEFSVIKSISSGAINTACILNHQDIRKPSYCFSCFYHPAFGSSFQIRLQRSIKGSTFQSRFEGIRRAFPKWVFPCSVVWPLTRCVIGGGRPLLVSPLDTSAWGDTGMTCIAYVANRFVQNHFQLWLRMK